MVGRGVHASFVLTEESEAVDAVVFVSVCVMCVCVVWCVACGVWCVMCGVRRAACDV